MENVMPLTIRGLAVVLFAIAAIGLGQISSMNNGRGCQTR
jgi:hypothetical protein